MRRMVVFWEYFQAYHWARCRELKLRCAEAGFEVQAIALAEGASDHHLAVVADGLDEVVSVLMRGSMASPGNDLRVRSLLIERLEKERPDVVIVAGYVGCVARSAVSWCRRNRKAVVLCSDSQEIDAPRRWWKELVKRRLVGRYDAGFASGTRAKAYLQKLGMEPERVVTGYDAVDNAFFAKCGALVRSDPQSWRAQLRLPPKYFLAVGRMVPKKGFLFLMRSYRSFAAAEAAAGREPWGLVIVGDGPERAAIESECARLEGLGRVLMPGYLATEKASAYFGLASVFVMPSLFAEQWGLVVNEAMAAGLPVLASGICGVTPDLVHDGKTGFRFAAGSEAELAGHMSWCAAHPERLTAMGAQAQVEVDRFSLESFATQLFSAAEKAIVHAAQRRGMRKWI